VSKSARKDPQWEMRGDRRHLALVLDEHDDVVGLISLENIREALIGDIEDETVRTP